MWNGTLTLTNMGVGRIALQVLGSSLPTPAAQVVEWPFGEWEVTGSIPRHTKAIKMVLVAPCLALRIGLVLPNNVDNVTVCGFMSSVWGMIFQRGSTIKVSIELPVANRHRHDVTKQLLKATLNQKKKKKKKKKKHISFL